MGELIAIRCDPEQTGPALRSIWADGNAALVLPRDAPTAVREQILTRLRPAGLLDLCGTASGPGSGPAAPTRLPSRLEDPLPVAHDVALVVTTSGSTGEPKGVELTHEALAASTIASLRRLGCGQGEPWALALPTHHVAGVQVLLRSWRLGTEAQVVHDLDELAVVEARHVSLVPTQLGRLLDAGAPVGRFATILLGGAAAAPELLERARAAGANVIVSYGMSETCGGCVYDGRPLEGVEVDVTDGRIRIRGPVVFRGYRGEPAGISLSADGWFTTGDLGRLEQGTLQVLGRADDVIVSGGENIPVPAVEDALRDVAGVAEVAVTGRPDREWGQVVVAVVVPRDPVHPPDLEALRAGVREQHPAAWAPRVLVVVEDLPRDPMGKLSRVALSDVATDP
jgi:o-succinylbenzoate---CoA ligase